TPTTTPTPAPTPQSKPLETPKPTPSPSPQPTPQPTPERAVETPKVPEPAHTPEIPKAETPKPATASSAGNAEAKKLFEESEKLPTSNKGGIAALEKALTLDPNNPTYQRQMVVRLYDTGEYALAAQRGDAFAKRGSTDVDMNLYIGAAYSRLGRHREALDAANRVLTVSKNNGYALFNRALNLKALGDPKATDAYKTFMEQCGSDPAFANYTEPAKAALKELEGK
ncbi:TPA: hypothetical protein DDW35_00615, partial [Candidatus Sumerlaeota bacterium]|nr:hypothetical protein [Candidatus Sumerlaeota bacterium]